MIRAFAPGMTMQEPLPQAASSFDVRQEPTAPEPASESAPAAEPAAAETHDEAAELARVEELLLERTRERRELAQELERRSALLRDACARLTELAPNLPEIELRAERDAAVARAVEAELVRAQATFKLDEVMGRLLAAPAAAPSTLPSGPSANERALNARLGELREQKQVADARLMLLEDELASKRSQLATAVRERVESAERFEFELAQVRAWSSAAQQELSQLRDGRGALLGERDGLRSRLEEAERALVAAAERLSRAQHQSAELKERLENERAERATLLTLGDARAMQLEELRRQRTSDHDQLRDMRSELDRERSRADERAAAREEELGRLHAQLEAHESELGRLQGQLEARTAEHAAVAAELERERAARSWLAAQLAAAEAARETIDLNPDEQHRRVEAAQQARLEALRACLLELRLPLVEFEAALGRIGKGQAAGAAASDAGAEQVTLPGVLLDPETLSALDEQLRQRDVRIEELEAALADRDARADSAAEREARALARDAAVATLKGELVDVRASAGRIADDLARERTRRRKMAVTVRALQAATESGEAPGPWIEELIALVNEGASIPPRT